MGVVRRRPPLTRNAASARSAGRIGQSRIPPQDAPARSLVPPDHDDRARQAQRSVMTPQMKPASSRATATVATFESLPRWVIRQYRA